jgi:hypothetical protein
LIFFSVIGAPEKLYFPKEFSFGAASAAYQIEGFH